jgi:hypothetical protein
VPPATGLLTSILSGPATGTPTTTGSMTIPRAFHTLTQLQNGQVLAAASETQNHVGKFSITASAELFMP